MPVRVFAVRSIVAACFALLALTLACSENDDGGGPLDPKPDPSPYSGTFYVKTIVTGTSCNVALPIDALTLVTVDGDSIMVGGMRGTWDEASKHGWGEYPAPTCIPVNPCTACTMLRFDIVFASVDSFTGAYYSTFTYSGCEAESCHTRYSVTGAR